MKSNISNVITTILLGISLSCFAAPVHDLCSNAVEVFESIPYNGSSEGATGSIVSSCSSNDTRDVWHKFIPSNTGFHTISLCGSSFDTSLSVYDACGGAELGCNEDVCGLQSELVIELNADQEYLIRVAGYGGETGFYTLLVTERLFQPANDMMEGAIDVFENIPYEGSTLYATGQEWSSCADGYDFYDVWHTFTPAASTDYTISLCSSNFDTTLSVFDQDIEIACNDDDPGCRPQSKLQLSLMGNKTYYIRIAGYDGDVGSYVLNITRVQQIPANDSCDNAIEVFLNSPYYGTSKGATGTKTSSCGSNDRADVWHTFMPLQSGYHTISLCGSSFNTTLSVYSSCVGAEIACNDDMCDEQSEVTVDMTADQLYYIRVAGKSNNSTGDYVLRVTERFIQPENDQCADAIEVIEDEPFYGTTIGALGSSGTECGYNFDFYDVWNKFVPTETKDYLVSLCGSDFDTTLAVYDQCGGAEIICNDDSCDGQSELVVNMIAGQTYYIRTAGYDGDMGNYVLTVTESVPVPVNDECVNAIELPLNEPFYGYTVNASGSMTSSCSEEDTLDVWHVFTAPFTGNYEISLCESDFDTTLSIFDACGGIELECNDDYCNEQSGLFIYLNSGQEILIRIAGYRWAMGNYTILIESDCRLLDEPANPYPAEMSFGVELQPVLAWNSGKGIYDNISVPRYLDKGIYGTDDRMDEYEITNSRLKETGDSTVALISTADLTPNGDGTYTIPSTTLAESYLDNYGRPLCPDEPFRDQPEAARCSGFLVAPDIIATTGHCIADDGICADSAFIFGYTMLNSSEPVVTFDESDVYFCAGIIARHQDSDSDWALIRLDREVLNHAPLLIRRSGQVLDNQDLAVIGHALGLPRKYADNAWVQDNTQAGYLSANLDTFAGNSGSAVVNMDTYEVEGLLFAGQADFVQDGDCDRSSVCPDTGCPGLEKVTRTTEFADLVPVFDVYLGTGPDTMQLISRDDPRPWCSTRQLECGMIYYWQVVAKNNCIQAASPIWIFSTEPSGDYDGDCDVDLDDFSSLAVRWISQPCDITNNFCQGIDIDMLGSVDMSDLLILSSNWVSNIAQ